MQQNELQDMWFNKALRNAGIDRERWHPSSGIEESRRSVEAVYTYYGRLFTEHPYLQWAGMAGLIGPTFYAGFEDLGIFPDPVRKVVISMFGRSSRRLVRDATGDLGFYETTFLTMQKKIFEDMAPLHEAYIAGGVSQIEEFYHAQIIDAATLEAWRHIDGGRRDMGSEIVAGNRTLLFREQHDIIDRYYIRMFEYHRLIGRMFTYLMTLVGGVSIPGAHTFPERYPLSVDVRLPRLAVRARTPLAAGNIAHFGDRWNLIEADTLPAYLVFLRDNPDRLRDVLGTPLSQRAAPFRVLTRAGQLAAAAVTNWGVSLQAAPRQRGMTHSSQEERLASTATLIDLTSAPTRKSAGFASESGSRVWADLRHAPFDLTVALAEGRLYRARSQMAVMLSTFPDGDPDRLTVQLPPADLAATTRLIGEYAKQWGLSAEAIASWHAEASRRETTDRHYATHVFTASISGPMRLEFQVSHHVRERAFVIEALFSWGDQP